MSITDPEEQTFVSQIVGEQQAAMSLAHAVSTQNMPYTVDGIPVSITIPQNSPGRIQYLLIVDVRDSVTGEVYDLPITRYSDGPLLAADVFDVPLSMVSADIIGKACRTKIEGFREPSVVSVRLVSVSRRA